MSISASSYEFSIQASGQKHVIERHIDQDGKEYMISYYADSGVDLATNVTAHAVALNEQLAQAEFIKMMGA